MIKYDHITTTTKQQNQTRKSSNSKYKRDDDDDCDCCSKRLCAIICTTIIFVVILIFYRHSENERLCLSDKCFKESCEPMYQQLVGGTMCMDLCVYKTLEINSCLMPTDPALNYRFFPINDPNDFTIMCYSANNQTLDDNLVEIYKYPDETTTYEDFKTKISWLIQKKLHYRPIVDELIMNLIEFADYNRDRQINTAEAKNLWSLLNNKATFYMLILQDRHYVPKIIEYCGNLLRTDEIISTYLYSVEQDTILPSVFPKSWKWMLPDWKYRCKIALSILEFVLDAVSFNPNDEFGPDSLYLCSPFETSFGYTFIYDAKLLNYESLFTGAELEERLSARSCKYDSDCIYSNTCIAKCNLTTNKCSSQLAVPQIVYACKLIKTYVLDEIHDNANLTEKNHRKFDNLLSRCLKFGKINTNSYSSYLTLNYKQTPKPFDEDFDIYNNTTYSLEYSMLSYEIRSLLWTFVKHVKDPVKPKRHTTTAAPNGGSSQRSGASSNNEHRT